MKQSDAYTLMIREYLTKCEYCEECFAEYFCYANNLIKENHPRSNCVDNIKKYLQQKKGLKKEFDPRYFFENTMGCCNCNHYQGEHGCKGYAQCEIEGKGIKLWNGLCDDFAWFEGDE